MVSWGCRFPPKKWTKTSVKDNQCDMNGYLKLSDNFTWSYTMIEESLVSTNPMLCINSINGVGMLKTFPNPFKKLQKDKCDWNEFQSLFSADLG